MGRQTERFYREIRRSHTVLSYVDVISPDQEVVRLTATDGQVDCDKSAAVRRKCTVQCIDPLGKLTPRKNGEILTPTGTEIRPYRGVRYTDGTTEICPLGVFRLSKASISDGTGGSPVISLEGFDRARTIQRAKFLTPYTIASGTNIVSAIKEIVRRSFPEIEYDTISSPLATTGPLLFDANSDPWEAVHGLATSIGCLSYFDVTGRMAILPPNDVNALPSPEFTLIEGDSCTMLQLAREYSDEPGFNGVIVSGQSIGDDLPPVRGEAWDDNPTSPTYRKGPYGEVPTFYTDNQSKTNDQAATVARSLLAQYLGFASKVAITATVNPSYEADDVLEVKRERAGVNGVYTVESFTVPLKASATQSLTLKELYPR